MNAVEMLKQQHREVERLFEQFDAARSAARRYEVFLEIADALAVHAAVEQQDFYPAVNRRRTVDMVLESVEAHLAIRRLIAQLMHLGPDDQQFVARMKVLRADVAHHVAEEEHDLFPEVEKLFDEERLDRIGSAMTRTQKDLREPEQLADRSREAFTVSSPATARSGPIAAPLRRPR
jgi:hemerythrin superfamily protein